MRYITTSLMKLGYKRKAQELLSIEKKAVSVQDLELEDEASIYVALDILLEGKNDQLINKLMPLVPDLPREQLKVLETIPRFFGEGNLKGVHKVLTKAEASWHRDGWFVKGGKAVSLQGLKLTRLPSFEEVGGDFYCAYNQLRSLEGAPRKVGGAFNCPYNQLRSLEGAPREVGGDFYCAYNQLRSLEGAPKEVGGDFDCVYNQLRSLEGAPREVGSSFYCSSNQLRSLEGAPREVGEYFSCSSNQLRSLEGAPREVGGGFYCSNNQLRSLEGAPREVGGDFYCYNNQLRSLEELLKTKVGGTVLSDLGNFPSWPPPKGTKLTAKIQKTKDSKSLANIIEALIALGHTEKAQELQKIRRAAVSVQDLDLEDEGGVYVALDILLEGHNDQLINKLMPLIPDLLKEQLQVLETMPRFFGQGNTVGVHKVLTKAGASWHRDGWVVKGRKDVYLHKLKLTRLPSFEEVGGSFYCSNNQLRSLEGAPRKVGGGFHCFNNQLRSLEGAPRKVGGGFNCFNNQLRSLEGAPREVGGNFYCYSNQLRSLEELLKTEVGGEVVSDLGRFPSWPPPEGTKLTAKMQNIKDNLIKIATKMVLEGREDEALALLSSFDNVMRLPSEQGQPGFGRGWGFGNPYEDYGYGLGHPAKDVPNTGDLPTDFSDSIAKDALDEEEDQEDTPSMEYVDEAEEEDIYDAHNVDLDVIFASVVDKVEDAVGKAEAKKFASLFGVILPTQIIAEEEERLEEDVIEEGEEKRPRSKRDVMVVWKEDLIPDVAPIIRRILKHVSVQYSIPFATLTNALRDSESSIASLLADALDKLAV